MAAGKPVMHLALLHMATGPWRRHISADGILMKGPCSMLCLTAGTGFMASHPGTAELPHFCHHWHPEEGTMPSMTSLYHRQPSESNQECLQVKCRGSENTLAECSIIKSTSTKTERAAVSCYDKKNECDKGLFTCVNGKCINFNQTCNGQNDCGDLSDELCCTECKNSFHCKADVCIPMENKCNGEVDCISGEDEDNCEGKMNMSVFFNSNCEHRRRQMILLSNQRHLLPLLSVTADIARWKQYSHRPTPACLPQAPLRVTVSCGIMLTSGSMIPQRCDQQYRR
ncbi:unnamed protein product [Ranitomeya imitator]|uniref:Uncharacterized protein n=1 Tax=Ranitomeya imitator TaxID=111125 RepID=A0ABN9MKH9_9NEOB|nr:unnamed protein product [Ranitomeya imitator]